MFVRVAFIAFALAGISQGAVDCDYSWVQNCKKDYEVSFPETEEDLAELCKTTLVYLECLNEHINSCDPETPMLEEVSRYLSIFREECNPDTLLFRAVADNLQCVKPHLQNRECEESSNEQEAIANYGLALRDVGIAKIATNEHNALYCISELYFYACQAAKIGKGCGEVAKEAWTEVFQKVLYPTDLCSEEILEDLPKIVNVLELADSKEETVEEDLSRKK